MRIVLLAILLLAGAASSFNLMDGGDESIFDGDLKYIRCSVCEKAVKHAHKQLQYIKKHNGDITSVSCPTVQICNQNTAVGEWINNVDVQIRGSKLVVVEHSGEMFTGKCRKECRTTSAACKQAFEEWEESVAEVLWNAPSSPDMPALTEAVCHQWSNVCPNAKNRAAGKGSPKMPDKYKKMRKAEDQKYDIQSEQDKKIAEILRRNPDGIKAPPELAKPPVATSQQPDEL